MATEVELGSLDLRYESFRLKAPAVEERLLGSIAQRGIEEPLEGVDLPAADRQAAVQGQGVLLNGFKRYRCARKLRLATVPYSSLGQDEAAAILGLLRTANDRALSILGQDKRLKSRAFHAQSHLLTGGILSRSRAFFHTLRQLHDRNGQA